MNQRILDFVRKYEKTTLVLFVIGFILVRLSGVHLPLHQDEYKWPMIVNPAYHSETSIPHPPLSQFIYRTAGYVVGFNVNFRFVPLFFGSINLVLLYWLVKIMFGKKEAVIASFIWIFSYFSVLASLMVDTDGEIMPFFFLLALIGYHKLIKSEGNNRYIWGALLVVSCVLGFLVKVSFLLAIGAILADFLWSKKHLLNKKEVLRYLVYIFSGMVFLIILLFVVRLIFPFFNLSESVKYWEHFIVGNRGWFQTAIQCIKAVLYSSPLLILVPFLASKNSISKVKLFNFFLLFSFIFYVVLFDFSIGALDRYLQLLVLPLTVISSVVISSIFDGDNRRFKEFFLLGLLVGFVLVLLQSFPHYVPPLHPKSDWIGRAISFRWNFLYPFSGGSGPLGFYVSFLFVALSWVITAVAVLFAKFKPSYKKLVLIFIIPIGFAYNMVFIEEYLFGYWNGHAPYLLNEAVQFIKNDPDIKMVTTYNDNGGNELQEIGKYRKRLYIDPKFDIDLKIATLNKYKEHYFVLNVPRIDPATVYQRYFDSCSIVYNKVDRAISATIYDCTRAPNIEK